MCSLQKMTSEKELKKLLPWYINHTLSPIENEEIEYWLQISTKSIQQTANEYQQIALGVTKQTNHLPKPEIREKLLTRINEPVRTFTISRWAIGISLALTIFFLLFLIFHPGIELKWTMLGNGVSAFRIYRAPQGSDNFLFIQELSKNLNSNQYQFQDTYLIPGKTYIYKIEVIDLAGLPTYQQSLLSKTTNLLVNQIALLLASVILSYGMISIPREWRYN